MTKIFQHIDTVFIPVRNVDSAAKWYTGIMGGSLGWKSEKGEYQCILFGQTSLTLCLTDDETAFQSKRAAFNFYVASAEEALAYLKSHDVQVEGILEYGAKYFAFYDPDGNALEVCEY